METQFTYNIYERRPFIKSKAPAAKWLKEWVPQDLVATENQLKALKEKAKEPPAREPESDSTSGKTFIDAGAFRKRSHINGERQYVCHYEGCGKKFSDSSKLKRHILIHTGERDFVCPHEGCGIFAGFQPKVTHENTFTRKLPFLSIPRMWKEICS